MGRIGADAVQVIERIADFRQARSRFGALAFVPTMGALHKGHLALVARAKAGFGAVAVSIFVNPSQFGPNEDFARYPRTIERDLALLEEAGVDLVFLPQVEEIYPAGFATSIDVGPVARRLEGAARPGHFSGVATVVCKLLNIVRPDAAIFGQKDVQQSVVIRALVRDLDIPVEIVIAPTERDADGLALSSRNIYLSEADRAEAPALYRALAQAAREHAAGERDATRLRDGITAAIARETHGVIEYVSIADPRSLDELDIVGRDGAVVSLVVRFGTTRLLDNVILPATD
jgi:pantoate--beta-alanine ligase